jgi:hypothetical protein
MVADAYPCHWKMDYRKKLSTERNGLLASVEGYFRIAGYPGTKIRNRTGGSSLTSFEL